MNILQARSGSLTLILTPLLVTSKPEGTMMSCRTQDMRGIKLLLFTLDLGLQSLPAQCSCAHITGKILMVVTPGGPTCLPKMHFWYDMFPTCCVAMTGWVLMKEMSHFSFVAGKSPGHVPEGHVASSAHLVWQCPSPGQRPLFPEKNVPKREELVTWEELPFAVADRLSLTEHVLYANLEGSSRLINLYS
ncbi:uncharacterized protein LOC121071097 isoform X4 [Cygnus olor]|uniref:uncharacterized protein LOC121071097 isoform X4 n=1 Tax=Cygnus olor TaxID=8869 RepID=UPI001ADE08CA|nr:uncharacterized protein LOC121071097 isoform X4 [Cygnus olor]